MLMNNKAQTQKTDTLATL